MVINQLMTGLTRMDAQARVVPGVAQRWQALPEGKTYDFWLNPKAKWQDGTPVRAEHVADGIRRSLTASTGSEYAFFLFTLQGAEAFYNGQDTDFKHVGVKVLGPLHVRMHLKRPVAFFPALMAFPVSYPVRLDVLAKHGAQWTEAGRFIGNGPFILNTWAHEDHLTLRPNPHWWLKPMPQVAEVDMRMINDANTSRVLYDSHQLHMIESPTTLPAFDIRRLKHRPDFHQGDLAVIHYFGFNTQKAPFNQLKVRQAFAYALDRQLFTQLLQSGQSPIEGFVTPGMPGYAPQQVGIHFNPAKARQLLAEAGYPEGRGFPPVVLAFRSLYDVRKEAEIAQYLWKKHLGINVTLHNMDWKVLLTQLKTDPPHLYKLNWYVDYPDPDSFLSLFIKNNGNNYSRWANPAYDAAVAAAVSMPNGPARHRAYVALQKQLLEQNTVLMPLYTVKKSMLVDPCVKGLTVNPLNILDLSQVNLSACPTGADKKP
jgi:oligopeptide transport system substrate-binding protein